MQSRKHKKHKKNMNLKKNLIKLFLNLSKSQSHSLTSKRVIKFCEAITFKWTLTLSIAFFLAIILWVSRRVGEVGVLQWSDRRFDGGGWKVEIRACALIGGMWVAHQPIGYGIKPRWRNLWNMLWDMWYRVWNCLSKKKRACGMIGGRVKESILLVCYGNSKENQGFEQISSLKFARVY